VNTFSTEDRTRTYQPSKRARNDNRKGEQFERELPPEILAELFRSRPRSPRMAGKRSRMAAGRVSPPPPSRNEPDAASHSASVNTSSGSSRRLTARWWLAAVAGISMIVAISLAIDQLPKQVIFSPPIDPATLPPAVEVRRALPIVEVRRALPAVPRALPVTSSASLVSAPQIGQWQPVRLLDGTIMQVCYRGELPSSAALPPRGRFIGEEYSTGNTSWIWMTPVGASFPSWVDP
jgi:hypothetical protein